MAGKTSRWWLLAASVGCATAFGMGAACSGPDPIVYSDRVPYDWELWEMEAGAPEAAAADAGTDATAVNPVLNLPRLAERFVFPQDNFWNKDISKEPLDPMGPKWLESMGLDAPVRAAFSPPNIATGHPGNGIPYQY